MRALMVAVLLSCASLAHAGNDSMFSLGIGSHTLVSNYGGASSETSKQLGMGQGFNARVRMLYALGMEFTYDLVSDRNRSSVNVPTPKFQWSGLLYLVPHRYFSLFLLGGFGSTAGSDLFAPSGGSTSYHGGAGIEIGITRNWVISADFRVNLPGYAQVVERGKQTLTKTGDMPSLTDYYNLESWQLNVGIRFYL